MSTDVELESWRRQWQSRAESAADADAVERLRRRVLRETRWIKLRSRRADSRHDCRRRVDHLARAAHGCKVSMSCSRSKPGSSSS